MTPGGSTGLGLLGTLECPFISFSGTWPAARQEVTQQFNVTEEQIKTVLDHVAHMLEEDLIIEETQR